MNYTFVNYLVKCCGAVALTKNCAERHMAQVSAASVRASQRGTVLDLAPQLRRSMCLCGPDLDGGDGEPSVCTVGASK